MRGSAEVAIKGTGLMGTATYIKKEYGDAQWRAVENELSPETRRQVVALLAGNWYPLETIDELWCAFQRVCHADDPRFPEVMAKMGEFIARDNLGTIYEVLLTFVRTPKQLMRIMPRLWKTYFRGVVVEVGPVGERGSSFLTRRLGAVNHISPVACGWIAFAFEKIGVAGVRVSEETYDAGRTASDKLAFRVEWG